MTTTTTTNQESAMSDQTTIVTPTGNIAPAHTVLASPMAAIVNHGSRSTAILMDTTATIGLARALRTALKVTGPHRLDEFDRRTVLEVLEPLEAALDASRLT